MGRIWCRCCTNCTLQMQINPRHQYNDWTNEHLKLLFVSLHFACSPSKVTENQKYWNYISATYLVIGIWLPFLWILKCCIWVLDNLPRTEPTTSMTEANHKKTLHHYLFEPLSLYFRCQSSSTLSYVTRHTYLEQLTTLDKFIEDKHWWLNSSGCLYSIEVEDLILARDNILLTPMSKESSSHSVSIRNRHVLTIRHSWGRSCNTSTGLSLISAWSNILHPLPLSSWEIKIFLISPALYFLANLNHG